MASDELRLLWEAVRLDFDEAQSYLSGPLVEANAHLSELKEWLDHNELGLALEELEMLGEECSAPPEFWAVLARAAARMGLSSYATRLAERSGRQRAGD